MSRPWYLFFMGRGSGVGVHPGNATDFLESAVASALGEPGASPSRQGVRKSMTTMQGPPHWARAGREHPDPRGCFCGGGFRAAPWLPSQSAIARREHPDPSTRGQGVGR
jgi:hypothetical protein